MGRLSFHNHSFERNKHVATARKTATPTKTTKALGGDISNAGEDMIALERPYIVEVEITGTAALIWHRWQSESVETKTAAAKGSAAKKTDDVESYVWRDENGDLCIPGGYLAGTIHSQRDGAAKYRQDPRSPRKSALDLFRAGIAVTTELAPIITTEGNRMPHWDYLDRRRVVVQRNGITRTRPAVLAGWSATFQIISLLPNYIDPALLHSVLNDAGKLVGIADHRPTYGRFRVTRFELLED